MQGPGQGGTVADAGLQSDYGYKALPHTLWHQVADASLGAGAPVITEISGADTLQLAGFRITAAADELYTAVLLNELAMDRTRDIHARIIYQVEEAARSGIDWEAWIKGVSETTEEIISNAKVSADGTIAWALGANIAADAVKFTEWKAFNVANLFVNDGMILLAVELDALGTVTSNKMWFMGMELRYTKKFGSASGERKVT